jgi:hypothetical protein
MVTVWPMGPSFGAKSMIETCEAEVRVMLRRFPTASYW